ncbi:MAG: hypothetical protein ACK4F9_06010 [Brevinematia bacterium]
MSGFVLVRLIQKTYLFELLRRIFKFIVFFVFCKFFVFFLFLSGFSVVNIDRNYIISPLKLTSTKNYVDFFTFSAAVAEFGKYLPEPYTDFNHFWIAKAGVFGEIFRLRDTFSFVLFSDIELIASSNSIIFFDPRAFYWQEGLLLSYKYNNLNFQFSFTHRCKHDIDNADFVSMYREVKARIVIWDSVFLRFFTDPIEIYRFDNVVFNFIPFFRNDFYVLGVDEYVWYVVGNPNIILSNDSYYRVNKVVDSISFGNIFDVEISRNFGFYIKWYLWFDFMGDNVIWRWSKVEQVVKEHYWEFSFYIKGDGIRLFFFVQNNFLRDPGIEPFDQGGINIFHFGLRAIDDRFSF